jgi:hypothetical protein
MQKNGKKSFSVLLLCQVWTFTWFDELSHKPETIRPVENLSRKLKGSRRLKTQFILKINIHTFLSQEKESMV